MNKVKYIVLNIIILIRPVSGCVKLYIMPILRQDISFIRAKILFLISGACDKKVVRNSQIKSLGVYSDSGTRLYNASVRENFFYKRVFKKALSNINIFSLVAKALRENFNYFMLLNTFAYHYKI